MTHFGTIGANARYTALHQVLALCQMPSKGVPFAEIDGETFLIRYYTYNQILVTDQKLGFNTTPLDHCDISDDYLSKHCAEE